VVHASLKAYGVKAFQGEAEAVQQVGWQGCVARKGAARGIELNAQEVQATRFVCL